MGKGRGGAEGESGPAGPHPPGQLRAEAGATVSPRGGGRRSPCAERPVRRVFVASRWASGGGNARRASRSLVFIDKDLGTCHPCGTTHAGDTTMLDEGIRPAAQQLKKSFALQHSSFALHPVMWCSKSLPSHGSSPPISPADPAQSHCNPLQLPLSGLFGFPRFRRDAPN